MTIDHILREERSRRTAMWRGLRGQCPQCGTKTLFPHHLHSVNVTLTLALVTLPVEEHGRVPKPDLVVVAEAPQ